MIHAVPLALTTDIVLFTIREERLALLLVRRGVEPFKGAWALPGGFVLTGESLDACAQRELAEETGLTGLYLEQLYTFGEPERDPRGRVVTVAYFALVPSEALTLQAGSDADGAAWHPVDTLPLLAFDHARIIETARARLAAKLDYTTIAYQFLPETFTLSDAQQVYETILGTPLDKRNFRKAALATGHLVETGDLRRGPFRPAALYRLTDPGRVQIIK